VFLFSEYVHTKYFQLLQLDSKEAVQRQSEW